MNANTINKGSDLIDRYVYATVRRLPASMRSDVDRELRTIIDDTLEARCGEVEPREQDVRVVLTELGTPSELSRKYDPRGDRSLISPKYFRTYTVVTAIVLACTAFGIIVSGIISAIVEPQAAAVSVPPLVAVSIGETIAKWFGILWSSLLQAFAICTLIFAFFELRGVELTTDNDLSKLPPVPQNNMLVKRSDCIFGLVISTIFLVIMCFAPQIMCAVSVKASDGAKTVMPIFNGDVIRSMWPLWVAFFVLGAGRELVKMFIGRYNWPLAAVTLVADGLSAILCGCAFLRSDIINPEFKSFVVNAVAQENEGQSVAITDLLFRNFNYFMFAVIIFALLLDVLVTVIRAARYSSEA